MEKQKAFFPVKFSFFYFLPFCCFNKNENQLYCSFVIYFLKIKKYWTKNYPFVKWIEVKLSAPYYKSNFNIFLHFHIYIKPHFEVLCISLAENRGFFHNLFKQSYFPVQCKKKITLTKSHWVSCLILISSWSMCSYTMVDCVKRCPEVVTMSLQLVSCLVF